MSPTVRWLIYDCLFSISPVLLVWCWQYLSRGNLSLAGLVQDGQLFLYCSTMSACGLSDLNAEHSRMPTAVAAFDYWSAALHFAVFFSAGAYGIALSNQDRSDKERVALASLLFAAAITLLTGVMRHIYQIF
jgi:hypothetical protein